MTARGQQVIGSHCLQFGTPCRLAVDEHRERQRVAKPAAGPVKQNLGCPVGHSENLGHLVNRVAKLCDQYDRGGVSL